MNLNYDLIQELRHMNGENASILDMVKRIKKIHGEEYIKLYCMQYLMEAFNLTLREVQAVGGFKELGGELEDCVVYELMSLTIEKIKRSA
ncbi:hypothetical protein [Aliikangiella coralliicola]|uniref:Uncharacterized protein n=1 Tax=Aliikangiella coralliicola TaxID=2592383 RepID=A0A545UI22_9GAMM|nr:hypothetical protein [Aliikangiella coralliicola]TQV89109.1 hypothetical protein FLL46_03000 [Aliikangiella coralliicola]